MVLSALWPMEWEVRFLEVRLFEVRWLWEVSKLFIVFLLIATQLAVDHMSCISCLVGNCFDDAL
jgi:hypothetical protein